MEEIEGLAQLVEDGTDWKQFTGGITIRNWAKFSGRDNYHGEINYWKGFSAFGAYPSSDLLELFEQNMFEMENSLRETLNRQLFGVHPAEYLFSWAYKPSFFQLVWCQASRPYWWIRRVIDAIRYMERD